MTLFGSRFSYLWNQVSIFSKQKCCKDWHFWNFSPTNNCSPWVSAGLWRTLVWQLQERTSASGNHMLLQIHGALLWFQIHRATMLLKGTLKTAPTSSLIMFEVSNKRTWMNKCNALWRSVLSFARCGQVNISTFLSALDRLFGVKREREGERKSECIF